MARFSAITKIFSRHDSESQDVPEKSAFLENADSSLKEKIMQLSECETLLRVMPDATGKSLAVIRSIRHQYLAQKLTAPQAKLHVDLIYDAEAKSVRNFSGTGKAVLCDRGSLPLSRNAFDIIVTPVGYDGLGDWKAMLSKTVAALKNGGRALLAFCHPQFEKYAVAGNQRSKSEYGENTVSRIFAEFKKQHLFVEDLTEGLVDAALKPYFVDENMKDHSIYYRNLPVTLVLRAVKFVRAAK